MEFRYGISPRSLARWLTFESIRAIQEQRGSTVGMAAMMRVVDAELEAIEFATFEMESLENASASYSSGESHG